jgi:hypothetical protein
LSRIRRLGRRGRRCFGLFGDPDEYLEVVVNVKVGQAVDEAVVQHQRDLSQPLGHRRPAGNPSVKKIIEKKKKNTTFFLFK